MFDKSGGCIEVISCGIGFPSAPDILALLEHADIVYGSSSLVSACPVPLKDARIIAADAVHAAEQAILFARSGKKVAVLASGDALYCGVGGTLAERCQPRDRLTFHPGVTAFQSLFCNLGLPWSSARLFSVHGGKNEVPAREIAEAAFSVTYAGSLYPGHVIARKIIETHPASARRAAVIAERLGSPEERLDIDALEALAQNDYGPTSMLVLLPCRYKQSVALSSLLGQVPDSQAPVLALGLPEDTYERESGLITASDMRAVILARLRLPAWGVMWDIGAGSGSVGLEAAALRPGLRVFGVEKNKARREIIRRNRERLGISNYALLAGEARAIIRQGCASSNDFNQIEHRLPAPDRIFIGGGGKALPELLDLCMQNLKSGGHIIVSAVTLESVGLLLAWHPEMRKSMLRFSLAREERLAGSYHYFCPRHPIYLFTFQQEILDESMH